jgi:hypothetical protein
VYYIDRQGQQREIFAVISSDDWNVQARHATVVWLTSWDKRFRRPWQVPVSGGYAVCGDVLMRAYSSFDKRTQPRIRRLTRTEMAAVAAGLEATLKL